MTEDRTPNAILRRSQVQGRTGLSRSTMYERIKAGVFPRPVLLGPRAVGWPENEVAALNAARIAGRSEAEIRELVARLQANRRHAA